MDALKFCNEKYFICGSDSPGGKPAIVQIWDIDALTNLATFPAHDTVSKCFRFQFLLVVHVWRTLDIAVSSSIIVNLVSVQIVHIDVLRKMIIQASVS